MKSKVPHEAPITCRVSLFSSRLLEPSSWPCKPAVVNGLRRITCTNWVLFIISSEVVNTNLDWSICYATLNETAMRLRHHPHELLLAIFGDGRAVVYAVSHKLRQPINVLQNPSYAVHFTRKSQREVASEQLNCLMGKHCAEVAK